VLSAVLQGPLSALRCIGNDYLSPPLLVLASFPTPGPNTPAHIPLLVSTFQSLFPPLSPKAISLASTRRVVLISYNSDSGTLEFRHYLIAIRTTGISRNINKILHNAATSSSGSRTKRGLKLGKEKDLADYILRTSRGANGDDGYNTSTSAASEADPEEDNERVASDHPGRSNKKGDRRAIRLHEIGPRMELRLIKITEGAPGKEGAVLFHQFVKKSAEEATALEASVTERERLKSQRREEQERNVARKKQAKEGSEVDASEDGEHEDDEEAAWEDEDLSEGEENPNEDGSEEDEPPQLPPQKKARTKGD